jgi:hypothetical protein
MSKPQNHWIARKIAQIKGGLDLVKDVDKAVSKFSKLSFHHQCMAYLFSLGTPNATGANLKEGFITGLKGDYQRENKGGTISVEKWLERGRAEPYFGKILKKLNITWEELETALKEDK